ncbi:MAG: GHKL domain-containing protein [Eubacterium ventriosum]|uniref:GHKL domain-containing protein n=1 Tax=Eubacterium ventriosum TaxID=39496 RepID=UPI00300F0CA9
MHSLDIDFVCIFGNLIDNAIEACETQSEKRIEIIVKEIKKLLIIKVINSYKGKLPDKLSTTKKEEVSWNWIKIKKYFKKYDEHINDKRR